VTRVIHGADELRTLVGTRLGVGDWLLVDQERIDGFARVTGDDQWIHVDPARAADGPFGTTIAHGWLTASLIPVLVRGIYRVEGVRSAINYGSDRVRFPAPVPVGSRVRAAVDLEALEDVRGGVQLTNLVTVEREDGDRPVCVARVLSRLLT